MWSFYEIITNTREKIWKQRRRLELYLKSADNNIRKDKKSMKIMLQRLFTFLKSH